MVRIGDSSSGPPLPSKQKPKKEDENQGAFGFYINMPNWSPLAVMLFLVLIVLPALMLFAYGWSELLVFWSGQVQKIVVPGGGSDKNDSKTVEFQNSTSNFSILFQQEYNLTVSLIEDLKNDEEPEPTHKHCSADPFYCVSQSPWDNKTTMLPWTKRCDGVVDCWDRSDELNCTKCLTAFSCPSDDSKYLKCLKGDKLCNHVADCADHSDETLYCDRECTANEFKCPYQKMCLPKAFQCDGERHCHHYGSDEDDCESCQGMARPCDKGSQYLMCVSIWDLCDGRSHCADQFDEKFFHCNSTETCPGACHLNATQLEKEKTLGHKLRDWSHSILGSSRQMHCADGKWYNPLYACNGNYPDCQEHCQTCGPLAFQCVDKTQCVPREKYHDGIKNCHDGTDEANCTKTLACDHSSKKCDGFPDCPDARDEANCTECQKAETYRYRWSYYYDDYEREDPKDPQSWIKQKHKAYHCLKDQKCIPVESRCDGKSDCSDEQDEKDCSCAECMMHPHEMYMCREGSRCFRYDEICNESFESMCPNATQFDQAHCDAQKLKSGTLLNEDGKQLELLQLN